VEPMAAHCVVPSRNLPKPSRPNPRLRSCLLWSHACFDSVRVGACVSPVATACRLLQRRVACCNGVSPVATACFMMSVMCACFSAHGPP
jgi:hypothetical protein